MLSKIPSAVWILGALAIGIVFLVVLIAGSSSKLNRTDQQMLDIAIKLEMDSEKFLSDFKSEEVKKAIESQISNINLLTNNDARSTPLVMVNDKRVNVTTLEGVIDVLEGEAMLLESEEKIKLEIYSDFTCPYCAQLFEYLEEQSLLKPELFSKIDYSKLNLPIIGGSISRIYAQAFEAAKLQEKGIEFARELYNLRSSK